MTILQVLYVLEVARQNSISKAAENLFVSQPALSAQIKRLEQELETIERRRSEALRAIGEKEALVARQEQEAAAFKALALPTIISYLLLYALPF